MSRCFPFPPPGYEAKTRIHNIESLEKDKRKDKKKHKKEKKHNETREHKEKNKDRSKDGNEGNEKEKHNEKNRETGRNKDGEKNPDGTRIEVQCETNSGAAYGGVSSQVGEVRDSKFLEDSCRSIRGDENGRGNHMAENFTGETQRAAERRYNSDAKVFNNRSGGKENNEQNYINNRRAEEQTNRDYDKRGTGKATFHNISLLHQKKTEGKAREAQKDYVRNKDSREGDDKQEGRQKFGVRKKKSNEMDKNDDEEKEKENKMKEKLVQRDKEQNKLEEISLNINSSHLPTDTITSAATEENLRKRKVLKTYGILLGNDTQPHKRPAFSSLSFEKNGKIAALGHVLNRWGAANNHKAKTVLEDEIDHTLEAQSSSTGLRYPPITNAHATEKSVASTKLEHPDSKYLSTIFSVPKMAELSEFDDQDWLFNSDYLRSKKPVLQPSLIDDTPQVWEKALQMDSVDTCALPYVIPY